MPAVGRETPNTAVTPTTRAITWWVRDGKPPRMPVTLASHHYSGGPMRIRFTLDITRTPRNEDIEPQREGAYSQAELSPQDQRDFADEGAYEFDDKRAGFRANP